MISSPSLLREHLEAALEAIESAHDTHIYSEDDEHPTNCHYCKVVREGRRALARYDREE